MKKILSFVLALLLCSTCLLISVSAKELDSDASVERLMPATFTYTTSTAIYSWVKPIGHANFDVTISGVYDLQGDNIISITSKSCTYTGGADCTVHDMVVQAYETPGNSGHITWYLSGTVYFSWTDPKTGHFYERTISQSPVYDFYALDCI